MYDFHPSCHDPCLWTSFDFKMLLQHSATMCTCYVLWARVATELVIFGQTCASAWPQIGSLDEKIMRDSHPKLCTPFLWIKFDFGVLLQHFATIHTCYLGKISPGATHFWPKMGGQLGRKCDGWLKMLCTISIPGSIIHVCESVLILECFCISL